MAEFIAEFISPVILSLVIVWVVLRAQWKWILRGIDKRAKRDAKEIVRCMKGDITW